MAAPMLPVLLLVAGVQPSGAPVQLTGSQVADLQVVGRWPTFQVARLASEVLWNRSNSSVLPQVSSVCMRCGVSLAACLCPHCDAPRGRARRGVRKRMLCAR